MIKLAKILGVLFGIFMVSLIPAGICYLFWNYILITYFTTLPFIPFWQVWVGYIVLRTIIN